MSSYYHFFFFFVFNVFLTKTKCKYCDFTSILLQSHQFLLIFCHTNFVRGYVIDREKKAAASFSRCADIQASATIYASTLITLKKKFNDAKWFTEKRWKRAAAANAHTYIRHLFLEFCFFSKVKVLLLCARPIYVKKGQMWRVEKVVWNRILK